MLKNETQKASMVIRHLCPREKNQSRFFVGHNIVEQEVQVEA